MRKVGFQMLAFLFFHNSLAGQADTTIESYCDTSYIGTFAKPVAIHVFIPSKSQNFTVTNIKSEQEVIFQPNEVTSIGIGAGYKNSMFGVSFKLKKWSNDPDIYGKTTSLDFRYNRFGRAYVWDCHWMTYQGYYVANPGDFISGWQNGMKYPLCNDLIYNSVSVSVLKVWNSTRFSYKAIFSNTEIQKKNAGTFLHGAYILLSSFSHPDDIIPDEINNMADSSLHYKNMSFTNIGGWFGYAHTFIIKNKFYISFSIIPGLGLQFAKGEHVYSSPSIQSKNLSIRGQFKMSAGFIGESYYWGIQGMTESFNYTSKSQMLLFEYGQFNLFAGKRFSLEKIKKWYSDLY